MRAIHWLRCLFLLVAILSSASNVEARISFQRNQNLTVSVLDSNPRAVALVDLKKDGRADIVAVDMENDGVTVFLNDGQGNFGDPQMTETGAGPVALATADFDKDGFMDVAVGNVEGDLSVSVLMGDGTGSLGFRRDFGDILVDPVALVAADFSGDRYDDLAVLSDDAVYIFINNGDGTFPADPLTIQTGSTGAVSIVAGLFNNDNNVDLAISNNAKDNPNVVILIGRGGGAFEAPVQLLVADQPQDLVVAQLVGSAAQDLAVVLARTGAESDFNVQVPAGNGDGTFQSGEPRTTASADSVGVDAADLDGDSLVDLVVSNVGEGQGAVVLHNDPNGVDQGSEAGFAQVAILGIGASVAVRIGGGCDRRAAPNENCPPDINGDGRPDIIALNQGGDTIAVLLNTTGDATPTRTAAGTPTGPPASASPSPTPGPQPPTSTPTPPPTSTATPLPTSTPTAILFVPYTPCVVTAAGRPAAVVVGNFDRNGSPDIVVADHERGKVVMLLSHVTPAAGDACGVLGLDPNQPGVDVADVPAPVSLATDDFDHDGKMDVAVAGSSGVQVLYGDGDGGFEASRTQLLQTGAAPRSIALADFNHDGLPDIIVADGTSSVTVFGNAAVVGFRSACRNVVGVGRGASLVVADDLNGDGRQDFAVASDQTNDVVVFLQGEPLTPVSCPVASLVFAGLQPALKLPGAPRAFVVGDLDSDTSDLIPDFAVAVPGSNASTDGRLLVILGRKSSSSAGVIYQNPIEYSVPRPPPNGTAPPASVPSALGAGDIDRNGRTDLVVADEHNDDVVLFFARGGSLLPAAPPVPVSTPGSTGASAMPVAIAMMDIDLDGVPDVVTANSSDRSISILISRLARTPTPLPSFTPTSTGTATATPTPTPSATSSPTATGTPLPTSTITSTPTRTPLSTRTRTSSPTAAATLPPTVKPGTFVVGGSCALDPVSRERHRDVDVLWTLGIVGALVRRVRGYGARRRRATRS